MGEELTLLADYFAEIENRKKQGLKPKPIDDGAMVAECIQHITDNSSAHRAACLDFFIYNTLPGTTSAAGVKAEFLKDIILGKVEVAEITPEFAFEQLSHMKGGRPFRYCWISHLKAKAIRRMLPHMC